MELKFNHELMEAYQKRVKLNKLIEQEREKTIQQVVDYLQQNPQLKISLSDIEYQTGLPTATWTRSSSLWWHCHLRMWQEEVVRTYAEIDERGIPIKGGRFIRKKSKQWFLQARPEEEHGS